MSRGVPYVRFYPSDWRSGCLGLPLKLQGIYIAICAYRWEAGKKLSRNPSTAAKALGLHTNEYNAALKGLLDAGKAYEAEDGITVDRAEVEYELAAAACKGTAKKHDAQAEGQAAETPERVTSQDTVTVTHDVTPQNTNGVISEKPNVFYAKEKNQNQNQEEKGSARARSSSYWGEALNPTAHLPEGVRLTPSGTIVLTNGTRAKWVETFGSDERLELALIAAAPYIEPNSTRPLLVRVEAQLARQAADLKDRDRRYQAGKKSDAVEAPKKRTLSQILRDTANATN